jgi:hypothetical protein
MAGAAFGVVQQSLASPSFKNKSERQSHPID